MAVAIPTNIRSKILWRVQEQCLKLLDPDAPRENGKKPSRHFVEVSSKYLDSLRDADNPDQYKIDSADKGDIVKVASLSSAQKGEIAQLEIVWIEKDVLTSISSISVIGTDITCGNTFPDSPDNNNIHIFDDDVTGLMNYEDLDGDPLTIASKGEIAQYSDTDSAWIMRGNITDLDDISILENISCETDTQTEYPDNPEKNDIWISDSGKISQYSHITWIKRGILTNIDGISVIGTNVTSGDEFPSTVLSTDDLHIFNDDATGLTGYQDTNGNDLTTASKGEIAEYHQPNDTWYRRGNLTDLDHISMLGNITSGTTFPSDHDENHILIFDDEVSSALSNYRDTLEYIKIEFLSHIVGSEYYNDDSIISLFPAVPNSNTILIFDKTITSIENYIDAQGKRLGAANKGDVATLNADQSSWIKRGNIYIELGPEFSEFKDGSIYVNDNFNQLIDTSNPANMNVCQPIFSENDLFIFNVDVDSDSDVDLPEFYDGTVKTSAWDSFNQLNAANEYEYWYNDPNIDFGSRQLNPIEIIEKPLTTASKGDVAQYLKDPDNPNTYKWYSKGNFENHLLLNNINPYNIEAGNNFPSSVNENDVFIFTENAQNLSNYYIKHNSLLYPRILRHVRVGSVELQSLIGDRDLFDESDPRWLPAIIIETGNDEYELTSSSDTRTSPLDSHPMLMIVNIRLIMLSLPWSQIMNLSRADQFDMSNPVRITHIRKCLDYLLHPAVFLNLTFKESSYKVPFRVKDARISQSFNLEGKASPFEVNDFRLHVKFDQPTFYDTV